MLNSDECTQNINFMISEGKEKDKKIKNKLKNEKIEQNKSHGFRRNREEKKKKKKKKRKEKKK